MAQRSGESGTPHAKAGSGFCLILLRKGKQQLLTDTANLLAPPLHYRFTIPIRICFVERGNGREKVSGEGE